MTDDTTTEATPPLACTTPGCTSRQARPHHHHRGLGRTSPLACSCTRPPREAPLGNGIPNLETR